MANINVFWLFAAWQRLNFPIPLEKAWEPDQDAALYFINVLVPSGQNGARAVKAPLDVSLTPLAQK